MRNKVWGRLSARGPRKFGKALLVPAALAVTAIAAACGDDEPKEEPLASCYAAKDSPTCDGQPQFCALTPDGGVCQVVS